MSGLTVYLFDRILRFIKSTREVRLIHLRPHILQGNSITELVLRVDHMKGYRAGTYAFINIPSISAFQWHPFSISSSPTDKFVTFHIKNMGTMTFTDRLHNVALSSGNVDMTSLIVRVDGPYGHPPDILSYDKIALVCGGIGVTPCHSILRTLYATSVSAGRHAVPTRTLFIWSAPHGDIFQMFEPSLREIAGDRDDQTGDGNFLVSLYATRGWGNAGPPKTGDEEEPKKGTTTFTCKSGRPKMDQELARLARRSPGERCLLFVCGPVPLMLSCQQLAREMGFEYHEETFAF
eukprot:TRINITY_DN21102_c0_g2_i1.p1 TRINITY_DN21102_c0_g2~~TRINITY_DN21102_c0_g2_i1.p1  ORF type:complete len:292 (-),score=8.15 TRINITY_DN21102_c0_g2_i1:79-954(-)